MITLTALQCRVIGVMLEKEITTPEHYPLSLNALTNACNQKSNREPVMSLSETQVQDVLDQLVELNQLMVDVSASGRVDKYKHRFCNTTFGNLQLSEQQKSIICVLFLRGPQTPGELRTRTSRLADFANVEQVEVVLVQLQNLNSIELVKKLATEPGKREARFIHLFSDTSETESRPQHQQVKSNSAPTYSTVQDKLETRVVLLEQEVDYLKSELARLSVLIELL